MSERSEVLIVGAGIVGAACAAACAREGLRVTVIEAEDAPGMATTAAGMGHLVVMDDSDAQFELTRVSLAAWRRLAPTLPPDCEYVRCGTIWIAQTPDEMEGVLAKQQRYGARGIAAQVLGARELYEREPNLRPGYAGGLQVPEDAVVYPPRVAAALLAAAQHGGARVMYGRRVTAVGDGGVQLADGAALRAQSVVVAGGLGAGALLPQLPLRPRKGHLIVTDRYPGFVRHQLVELGYLRSAHDTEHESVAFNVQPRSTGQLLIGSSRQPPAPGSRAGDLAVEEAIVRRMLVRAAEFLPGLGALDVLRMWAGHRPATPDGLPYIGPLEAHPQIVAAIGHEGLGITTATGTAELVVAHLLGRACEIDPSPFLPARAKVEPSRA